jgi:hypothetical protein
MDLLIILYFAWAIYDSYLRAKTNETALRAGEPVVFDGGRSYIGWTLGSFFGVLFGSIAEGAAFGWRRAGESIGRRRDAPPAPGRSWWERLWPPDPEPTAAGRRAAGRSAPDGGGAARPDGPDLETVDPARPSTDDAPSTDDHERARLDDHDLADADDHDLADADDHDLADADDHDLADADDHDGSSVDGNRASEAPPDADADGSSGTDGRSGPGEAPRYGEPAGDDVIDVTPRCWADLDAELRGAAVRWGALLYPRRLWTDLSDRERASAVAKTIDQAYGAAISVDEVLASQRDADRRAAEAPRLALTVAEGGCAECAGTGQRRWRTDDLSGTVDCPACRATGRAGNPAPAPDAREIEDAIDRFGRARFDDVELEIARAGGCTHQVSRTGLSDDGWYCAKPLLPGSVYCPEHVGHDDNADWGDLGIVIDADGEDTPDPEAAPALAVTPAALVNVVAAAPAAAASSAAPAYVARPPLLAVPPGTAAGLARLEGEPRPPAHLTLVSPRPGASTHTGGPAMPAASGETTTIVNARNYYEQLKAYIDTDILSQVALSESTFRTADLQDDKVYGGITLLREALHLAQSHAQAILDAFDAHRRLEEAVTTTEGAAQRDFYKQS